jgi:hypothetical protein
MTKYMVLYMAPLGSEEQMQNASPEEGKKVMDMWMAWYGKVGSAVVDGGTPLGKGRNVSKTGKGKGQSQVAGYTIMQADNMSSIEKLLDGHPHLMMPGASIDVLEMMPIEM